MSESIQTNATLYDASVDPLIDEILQVCPEDELSEEWLKSRYPKSWNKLVEPLRHAVAIRRAERLAEFSGAEEFFDIPLLPSFEKVEFLKYQLNGYSLRQQLGQGGQAEVYEAIQESTGRPVAVKFLREGPLASPSQQARFKREISLVTRLRHTNIVQVYDSGTVAGHNWFSMECVRDALCIDDFVLLRQLALQQVIELFVQVVRAVGYAHQNGVIHRDIKPSNILVDDEGVPRVVDFGLAKDESDADEAQAAAAEGHILGTLPYLSPEQASGGDGQVDVRSDVYSLGVVLYQLVTGQWPYDVTGSSEEVRKRIVATPARRPSLIRCAVDVDQCFPRGEINDDFDQILLKSLTKSKEERYQSAIELADDLDRYLRGDAIAAKSSDSWYIFRKTARRYRTQLVVASAFVLLLGASLLVTVSMWRRAERVARLAQRTLNAAAFFRVGSVTRDDDRNDAAIALFQRSIEIAEDTYQPDNDLMALQFDASVSLARIFYDKREFDRANRLTESAARILRRAKETSTSDLWIAKESTFQALLGMRDRYENQHEASLYHFQRAVSIADSLVVAHSSDPERLTTRRFLQGELSSAQADVGCYENAIQTTLESRALAEDLWTISHSAEDRLAIIMCDAKLARCYANLRKSNYEDHQVALMLIRGAKESLNSLEGPGRDDGLRRNVSECRSYVDKMEIWVERRAMILLNWRAGIPHESGSNPFEFTPPRPKIDRSPQA